DSPNTPELLSRRVAQALGDASWRRNVRHDQLALLDRYDVTTVADQVEEVYRQAIQDRRLM
ncbi:MAG: glycosyltransferase family 1 protein, partial [Bifidobacterium sp.]|nr:glycosyltransferase family 1 protein [Bifidobacterium sp.]